MWKRKYLVWFFIAIFIMNGCISTQFQSKKSRFELKQGQRMAVLDFEQQGLSGGGGTGAFAADELSRMLFVKKQYPLVDRSIVRARLAELNVNPKAMSLAQIQKLGKALDVDILVLGSLTQFGDQIIDESDENKLEIQATVRLLSVRDGSNLAMITERISMKNDVKKSVSRILEKIVSQME